MFSYRQYQPSPLLAGYIECYWALHASDDFIQTPDRLIPGGRVEMMFSFAKPIAWLISEDSTGGINMQDSFLMGQRNKIYYAKSSGKTDMVGVRFRPGGLAAFTNMPVSLLLNSVVPAEFIFGNTVKNWAAMLYEQGGDDARIQVLDTLLQNAIKHSSGERPLMNHAIDALRNGSEAASITTICDETGMYYKKLERLFLKNIGYTPKYYHKILRFNKAIRLMETKDSLTDICYECNYFDQSHFIRDFKQLAGSTPGRFKKEDNKIASFLIKHQPV
jgi:AraC-like DNA-binding protein